MVNNLIRPLLGVFIVLLVVVLGLAFLHALPPFFVFLVRFFRFLVVLGVAVGVVPVESDNLRVTLL